MPRRATPRASAESNGHAPRARACSTCSSRARGHPTRASSSAAGGSARSSTGCATRYDLVIIDTPPILRVGDAMTLSTQADGVLIVTRLNVIRRPMLAELRRLLATAPATKLGFVVTGSRDGQSGGYGYGYDYGGYGYAEPKPVDKPTPRRTAPSDARRRLDPEARAET